MTVTPQSGGSSAWGWKRTVGIAFVVSFALMLMAGVALGLWANSHARKDASPDARAAYANRSRIRSETVLVVGASGESVVGLSVIRADEGRAKLWELTVSPDMLMSCPTGDATRIADIFEQDPAYAVMLLSRYLEAPIAQWVVVPADTYSQALEHRDPRMHFAALERTSFSKAAYLAYRERIDALPPDSAAVVALATRSVECAGTLFIEPHREMSAEFVADAWETTPQMLFAATRVGVFNGTETDGLAGKAAKRIVTAGFQIAEIGNAPDFSYDATVVEAREGFEDDARRIASTLGIGEVDPVPVSDSKAAYDVAVFLGTDFRP